MEEGDDEAMAAAPKVSVSPAARLVEARYVVGLAKSKSG